MSDDGAGALVRAIVLVTGLTIASYMLLKALPALELYAQGARARALEQWRDAQAWHRARSEVLFEAYYATREAAE